MFWTQWQQYFLPITPPDQHSSFHLLWSNALNEKSFRKEYPYIFFMKNLGVSSAFFSNQYFFAKECVNVISTLETKYWQSRGQTQFNHWEIITHLTVAPVLFTYQISLKINRLGFHKISDSLWYISWYTVSNAVHKSQYAHKVPRLPTCQCHIKTEFQTYLIRNI